MSAGRIVERVAALVPWMQRRAAGLDANGAFPAEEIIALHEAGALATPLPIEQQQSADTGCIDQLNDILTQCGAGNLSVGRIVEAHINARHLIARFGTRRQRASATDAVQAGHLFALWVTDHPDNVLRMSRVGAGVRLDGGKQFCSAAGVATHTLVTATDEDGASRMLVVRLGSGERIAPLPAPLQGMRAAVTGAVDFTGCVVDAEARLGEPGDYLREPDFSAGAWRGSAVAAGGLQSLLRYATAQLAASGRLSDPHQLQRLGTADIAGETCRLWVRQAARYAEDRQGDPAHIVAYTGLARIAVETACLDAMRLVQRSLGLSAFRMDNPAERICRDLATYLRQPAPDAVLTEAGAHFARA